MCEHLTVVPPAQSDFGAIERKMHAAALCVEVICL